MVQARTPEKIILSDKFSLLVEDNPHLNQKTISFVYTGLVESNEKNLMLVIFPPDSENPIEIPMPYDAKNNHYKVAIETADIYEMFLITTAKIVGNKDNPQATVLHKGFIALHDGIFQPVNKLPNIPEGQLKKFLLTNNGDLIKHAATDEKLLPEGDRFVTVYLPPGYNSEKQPPYKLQITLDGGQYLNPMQMNIVMDNLIAAKEIEPTIIVFISPHSGPPKEKAKGFGIVMPDGYTLAMRLKEYCCNPVFADKLSNLATTMRQQFNVSTDRKDLTLWGVSAGGLQAIYTSLLHSNIFGNVVAESPMSWNIPLQNGPNWREGIVDTWNDKGIDITWSTATAKLPMKENEHNEHVRQMVHTGYDSISNRKLDASNSIRFYLDAGATESEYDPRPEVGSANLLKGAEVFAAAAMEQGHQIVGERVHVIANGGHHNMTWMRNQANVIISMHSRKVEKKYSESLTVSVTSQSIFSSPQASPSSQQFKPGEATTAPRNKGS